MARSRERRGTQNRRSLSAERGPGTRLLAALLFWAALLGARSAIGDDDRVARGELLYRIHCSSCHGKKGQGDGPLAEAVAVSPTDLRTLARSNDGEFSAAEVYRAIDGRSDRRSHGPREMPVWGLTFMQSERDSPQESEITARITDLVAFLESIQTGLP